MTTFTSTLSADTTLRLKAATRRQVRASGGIEAAAAVLPAQKSTVGGWQAIAQHSFIPIQRVAELQADSGDLSIVTALAQEGGAMVIPLNNGNGRQVVEVFAELVSNFGALATNVASALDDAGEVGSKVSRGEGVQLISDLDTLMATAARLRGRLVRDD